MKLKGIELNGTYKVTYFSTSFGIYNEKGNRIYYENSNGYWEKWEYNELGNVIYFENSNGEIIGERVKDGERVKELPIEETEGLFRYKIKKLKEKENEKQD